jgi:hypothetical protein
MRIINPIAISLLSSAIHAPIPVHPRVERFRVVEHPRWCEIDGFGEGKIFSCVAEDSP